MKLTRISENGPVYKQLLKMAGYFNDDNPPDFSKMYKEYRKVADEAEKRSMEAFEFGKDLSRHKLAAELQSKAQRLADKFWNSFDRRDPGRIPVLNQMKDSAESHEKTLDQHMKIIWELDPSSEPKSTLPPPPPDHMYTPEPPKAESTPSNYVPLPPPPSF